jgi:hypothetical protein
LPSSFALESSPPERMIGYSIIVQKTLNGEPLDEPFEASGHERFESGWKFRLRLSSPQPGYLYLLNEGPMPDGGENYRLLFPISSINHGSARIAANEPVLTGWYVFAERPGVEKLWIVWAAAPVNEFEAAGGKVNPIDQGIVSEAARRDSIREWLVRRAAGKIVAERGGGATQTVIRGHDDVLASLIKLEHRQARPVVLYDPIRGAFAYYR